jgi:hypothetical protein
MLGHPERVDPGLVEPLGDVLDLGDHGAPGIGIPAQRPASLSLLRRRAQDGSTEHDGFHGGYRSLGETDVISG